MIKKWIGLTRPKTLPASLAPVILGLSYAHFHSGRIDFFIAGLTIISTLLMQVGTNLVNDYFDFKKGSDKQRKFGPKRLAQSSDFTPEVIKKAYQACLGMAFLVGCFLIYHGGLPILIIGLTSILGAYCYTAGPFPLSYNGLGEIAAFIFFGPVAVWGTFFVQTHSYDLAPVALGIIPGLLCAAIMSINNLRDQESDALSGKKTLAVRFGRDFARSLPYALVVITILFVITIGVYLKSYLSLAAIIPLIAYLFASYHDIFTREISAHLNETLGKTGKLMFITSALFSIGLI